jgi:CDP-4-dehydro-6-deoxyglucose reductase
MPNLRYVPVVSDAARTWREPHHFVHLKKRCWKIFPLSGHQVYTCGAPIVVESAQRDFTELRPADMKSSLPTFTEADKALKT